MPQPNPVTAKQTTSAVKGAAAGAAAAQKIRGVSIYRAPGKKQGPPPSSYQAGNTKREPSVFGGQAKREHSVFGGQAKREPSVYGGQAKREPSFYKAPIRKPHSFYEAGKKTPSFYAPPATKKTPPTAAEPTDGSADKTKVAAAAADRARKSSISSVALKPKSQISEYKPAPKHHRKTDKTQKASFYETTNRQIERRQAPSAYKIIKSPQPAGIGNWIKPSTKKSHRRSLMNLKRLKKDGRKIPDDYRQRAAAVQSPSQLSLKSISELYVLQPNTNFVSNEDVFKYRGYKKLQKIDEGAFGIVSKAVRISDRTLVAVKEVDLRRKRAKRIEEMKRELFVLQKVEDENVVKLIEHFIIDQMLVIIMEFCAGGNLTSYLKETAINEQEALFLFKQMAFSIKVLHKKGIAHRDVKLNNFLLDSTRKLVKIGDFGLSVVSYRPNVGVYMAKTYCGTEPYMAPEILKRNSMGVRSYNPIYADVWSLGVCLFAMLTRTFPFKMHTSQHGLHRAQVTRRWRFPKSLRDMLSEEIKDLVWHMLDPEPERRISMNGVIAHPWLNQSQLIVLSYGESETESTHSSIR